MGRCGQSLQWLLHGDRYGIGRLAVDSHFDDNQIVLEMYDEGELEGRTVHDGSNVSSTHELREEIEEAFEQLFDH